MTSKVVKKLINKPKDTVNESLNAFVAVHQHQIRQLEAWPRVIVRADLLQYRRSGKVSLICGGGSGHEPVFAGYVGSGALTAAVAGSIFASPPADPIIAALRAVSGPAGTVVFIFNYTGDRLNFGLAIERAKQFESAATSGLIRAIILGEDTAVESKDKSAGRRGLAGSLMVLKMAGAMAESGRYTVDEIADAAIAISNESGTMGLSLSSCSLPGQGHIFSLGHDEMEVGLGVHGEPGVRRCKLMTAKDAVNEMLSHMTRNSANGLSLENGQEVAVLVNNLCSMTEMEMNIVYGEAITWLNERGMKIKRMIVGTLYTSLEMQGISVSLLRLVNSDWISLLDAGTNCVTWPKPLLSNDPSFCYKFPPSISIPDLPLVQAEDNDLIQGVSVSSGVANKLKKCVLAACLVLIDNESELNRLDQAAGDGDCGITLQHGATAMMEALNSGKLSSNHPSYMFAQMSKLCDNIGGTSGAIYALLLSSVAVSLEVEFSGKTLFEALKHGTQTIMEYGKAEPGDRTLVDPLCAAVSVLENEQSINLTTFEKAVEAAEKSAEETVHMKARAGRASYVSTESLTLPDAGAKAVALWMRAALEAYKK